ncbi:hypothetical protein [Sulfidibacter corallicola]|uniref:Uncharacterized protein n=1 Tax=Sulfidibacter corallicola TaxID=2818388 RepID=A0A8A4TRF7_SULCO|nr:hypothetical protein [Sulfidibacter corallicola]QTD51571.1 hypothetical protein J3U87_03800 [Sulfidibacter corallicola]
MSPLNGGAAEVGRGVRVRAWASAPGRPEGRVGDGMGVAPGGASEGPERGETARLARWQLVRYKAFAKT